jgi:hypothetical protein
MGLIRFLEQPFLRYREKTDEGKPIGILKNKSHCYDIERMRSFKIKVRFWNNFFRSHASNLNLISIERSILCLSNHMFNYEAK